MIFNVSFTDNIELVYSLIDHPIADDWAKLITTRDVTDCCEHNHYFGYATEEKINQRIERLHELADIINIHVSEKIVNTTLTVENFRQTLHVMHVHFPALETDPDYAHLHPYLSEYNDTIHWLETILAVVWGKPPGVSESGLFSINLDFNVPQSTYCASARLYFTDNFSDTQEKKNYLYSQWQDFYGRRGGKDYFGYDIDDPNMRLGFIKIGNLKTIHIDGNSMKVPETQEELDFFRKLLVNTEVIGWTVE